MTELKNTIEYKFLGDLSYIKDGENIRAEKITVKAPKNKYAQYSTIIDQEYSKAQFKLMNSFKDLSESKDISSLKEKDEALSSNMIMTFLMGGGGDVVKCYTALKSILLSGSKHDPMALIDDVEQVTSAIYDDMSLIDTRNLLGEYILSFLAIFPND